MIAFLQELQTSRPLKTAIAASLLWHLVWLFVIFIDVQDPVIKPKLEPKIYFVGSILSDDAFNMILEAKPELSTTVYRTAAPLDSSLEPQPQSMERPDPGDLVSVPLGQSTWVSLRGHLQNEKPYPEAVFRKKLSVAIIKKPFPIQSGPLSNRDLLSVPVLPILPERTDPLALSPEFEISVLGTGEVKEVRMIISSGDPEVDRVIERYLQQWRFVPLEPPNRDVLQTGRIQILLPERGVAA